MKKILYISDYTLNEYNSVRDILYHVINNDNMEQCEHVIVKASRESYNPIGIEYYDGFKMYLPIASRIMDLLKSKQLKLWEKVGYICKRVIHKIFKKRKQRKKCENKQNIKYIRKIINIEKPDLVVLFTYSPEQGYANICLEKSVPYICILYDTYIGRPGINKEDAYYLESKVINNSEGYYIPDFFFEQYLEIYGGTKLHSLELPLLIDKDDVIKSFKEKEKEHVFSYFGRIQSFRKGDEIKGFFEDLGIKLDVFTTEKYNSDRVFKFHSAETGTELYKIVAGSKYLVAFDNGYPYQDYLPSKVFLYVSFTKPIVAFGDNETSALKVFLKDYPYFYYQNINESVEGLKEFLSKTINDRFDEEIYKKYEAYLPEKALKQFALNIKTILDI